MEEAMNSFGLGWTFGLAVDEDKEKDGEMSGDEIGPNSKPFLSTFFATSHLKSSLQSLKSQPTICLPLKQVVSPTLFLFNYADNFIFEKMIICYVS